MKPETKTTVYNIADKAIAGMSIVLPIGYEIFSPLIEQKWDNVGQYRPDLAAHFLFGYSVSRATRGIVNFFNGIGRSPTAAVLGFYAASIIAACKELYDSIKGGMPDPTDFAFGVAGGVADAVDLYLAETNKEKPQTDVVAQ